MKRTVEMTVGRLSEMHLQEVMVAAARGHDAWDDAVLVLLAVLQGDERAALLKGGVTLH